MKKNSKIKNSKLNPVLQAPNSELKKSAAFLWDESFLWGLMAYRALKANNLPFELIRSDDIKNGCLKNYKMLFVPGGWASNKLKALGSKGIDEIKRFVCNGGNYLGFCGGAGLATLDSIGLLDIKRMPTKQRVPSFSGRIHLNINKHPIWKDIASCAMHHVSETSSRLAPNASPSFHAWWPSQFLTENNRLKILATYSNALPDSFSSDLNVGDVEMNSNWTELEEIYGINLNPERLKDKPAVIEGTFGKGRVILSLIHFDTPDDANGAVVLKNLWKYLDAGHGIQNSNNRASCIVHHASHPPLTELLSELEAEITELISLGIRNFLWFWRTPMLLQWRRGVRGLEYCTLYVMIKELSGFSYQLSTGDKEKLKRIKKLLMPFVEKTKQLLILERYAMQNGHITPLSPLVRGGWEGEITPHIQKIRTELFGDSKSHGGLFKELIDETDKLLYALIKAEAARY